ncbi:hypothetical protein GCM10010168_91320 [Actinoplanes ianthinogenes]|uniref:Uncharacterized protein n=1 Tax=Actinoplanes ianthinogenes TaxID=122358 RepID=A0ABM7LWX2_9ACTN|nr:hypothetical protein Aiant_44820 [Actinoplanes ianthinogenes]GGR58208.1 hypothetical protein GCM10010168_91320 [Actinoplanes ianthinogenes]
MNPGGFNGRTEDSRTVARQAPRADSDARAEGGRLEAGPGEPQAGSRSVREETAETAGAAITTPASSPSRAHHRVTFRRLTISLT